jgi:hypothetical protein
VLPMEKGTPWMGNRFRVLPYRMQDQYTRQREPMSFHAIVSRTGAQSHLPAGDGRRSRPCCTSPRAGCTATLFPQPANLAIRNAWFSGG